MALIDNQAILEFLPVFLNLGMPVEMVISFLPDDLGYAHIF